MNRKLLVTHHAPDLDAVTAVWLLKRFGGNAYADAKVAFVNPGETISEPELIEQRVSASDAVHVDTGLGEFDHHQPERGSLPVCATTLVFDYLCQDQPDLKNDTALHSVIEYVNEIDHFGEIHWPDAAHPRYSFMVHELIRGAEFTDPHNDESQMYFGFTCLDNAYAVLKQQIKAGQSLAEHGRPFMLQAGQALAIESRNDDTIKLAQKQGNVLVVRKDDQSGHIRVKVRPDCEINLAQLAEVVRQKDPSANWYFHPGGKMLLNGSTKHLDQRPSQLSLDEMVKLIQELYG